MKTEKEINNLFKDLDFDISAPSANHEARFREKLRQQPKAKKEKKVFKLSLLRPVLSIAASLLIAFLIFQGVFSDQFSSQQELANVSPEMKQTQDFYTSAIKTELASLQTKKTPGTEAIINDALLQLEILENDYETLKKDLGNSGQDKRVIFAMISNFQKRIDLLQMVLEKVNTIESLNNLNYENTTI